MLETVGHRQRSKLMAIVLLMCGVLAMFFQPAMAQSSVMLNDQLLERGEDGVYLSATLDFALSPGLEDALSRGLPLTFVLQAEVMRERWYWYDKRIASAQRQLRLAYQPLTRRWRVNPSAGAGGDNTQGLSLNQSFDTLAEALSSVRQVSQWKVADLSETDLTAKIKLQFRFRLDLSQLPRPFQIGAIGQSEWDIQGLARTALRGEGTR
jgi:hypothetical protein